MKKKIGEVVLGNYNTPLWGSIFNHRDDMLMTIYFTKDSSPRYHDWYKKLDKIGFRIIQKGSWRYGYYYKILATESLEDMQKILDKLEKIKSDDVTFDIKKSVRELYNRIVLEKI